MKKLILILSVAFTLNLYSEENGPVKTVDFVDLSRYIGTWYEVASIPQKFQKECSRKSAAEYSLTDSGEIKVINSCETSSGSRKIVEGRAKVAEGKTNSKLKVTFVHLLTWIYLFGGDYWILDLADDYSYAVIGDPDREYAWILSRTPAISPKNLQAASESLRSQGYDICKVLTSVQDEGFKERKPICEMKNL